MLMGRVGCCGFLSSIPPAAPGAGTAGSAWRGNRRMTRLRRHPATHRPMALTLPY
ncbi:hypothetical protein RYU78_003912 [Salmonella enterica subsp. enterica serovar Enteritidis]|nr:hypothetical protein [Salmonella enterica subsp. enterica serovar Enteritidis]